MMAPTTASVWENLAPLLTDTSGRYLQQIPDYTSPPLPIALDATPEAFRSDAVIDAFRDLAGAGNCTTTDGERCHIPFPQPEGFFENDESKIGVIFYGGGLVDPRGYSVFGHLLSTRYGLPTVIPIFENDLAFSFAGECDSGRLDFAKAEFPNVEKWVLAGHSFGGIGAMSDLWERWNQGDDSAAGLVMIAADIRNDIGCGAIDFSMTDLPMASVLASLDGVLNRTRVDENQIFLSNNTQFVDIFGGNHALFGAYDDSERFEILGQTDGEPLITPEVQWDFTLAAIASVASRTGVPMPVRLPTSLEDDSSSLSPSASPTKAATTESPSISEDDLATLCPTINDSSGAAQRKYGSSPSSSWMAWLWMMAPASLLVAWFPPMI